jgi:ubiquitin carboxyl-terminal hydrolase 7
VQLTRSFGWGAADSFLQHDVQELSRVLCDKLEEKMKGTPVEGTMQALFEGHTTTYIECLDVPYTSSRHESFLDLQLDVRGCCDVLSSFERFVEAEQLNGDNAYAAEGFGLQHARKGVRFTHLPPVLQLQLKRFEYDSVQDGMQKLNDRYEFPLELDLTGFVHAPSDDPQSDCCYALHSVLVHSGGASGGHYYAYVRPTCAGLDWFCFDDDRVTRVDASCAVEDNFGGGSFFSRTDSLPPFAPGRLFRGGHSSAYMLVYVRIQDIPRVVCPHSEADIPERVRLRLEAEAAEKARAAREQDEAHMYTLVRVAADRDIAERLSSTRHEAAFDLVDWAVLPSLRVEKHATFHEFKGLAAAQLGVPVERQRWWCWNVRMNSTLRPCRAVLAEEDGTSIGAFGSSWQAGTVPGLLLYLETLPAPCHTVCKGLDHALLFFKVRLLALRAVLALLTVPLRSCTIRQARPFRSWEVLWFPGTRASDICERCAPRLLACLPRRVSCSSRK